MNIRAVLPEVGYSFSYSLSAGQLCSVGYPGGATADYTYDKIMLGNSLIQQAVEVSDGEPRIWFGPDYSVITFQTDSSLTLRIYSWLGGWFESSNYSLPAAATVENLRVECGQGFFVAFHKGLKDPGPENAFVFTQSKYAPDQWIQQVLPYTVAAASLGSGCFAVQPLGQSTIAIFNLIDPDAADRKVANPGGVTGDSIGSVQEAATGRPVNPFTIGLNNMTTGRINCCVVDTHDNALWNNDSVAVNLTNDGGDAETRPKNLYADFFIYSVQVTGNPFPIGGVIAYAGDKAPPTKTWMICEGGGLTIDSDRDLARVIGSVNGGDGATRFNVPDCRGRFLRGRDGGAKRDNTFYIRRS